MFNFDKYAIETRPITFLLLDGSEFKTEYFVNYLSETNLAKFDKEQEEADAKGTLTELQRSFATHLSRAISKIDYIKGGEEHTVTSEEDKFKILLNFSYLDLRNFASQLNEDLGKSLDTAKKTSSDGQAPKEE